MQYLPNLQQQKVLRGSGSSRRTSPCAAEINTRMNIDILNETAQQWGNANLWKLHLTPSIMALSSLIIIDEILITVNIC